MTKIRNTHEPEALVSSDLIEFKLFGKFIKGIIIETSHINKTQYITLKNVKTNLNDKEVMGNITAIKLKTKDGNNTSLWELKII